MLKITYEIDKSKTVAGLPAPNGWHIVESRSDEDGLHARAWESLIGKKMFVIESVAVHDGRTWLHVSLSLHNRKMPAYEDLQLVRKLFIGEERESYMIFPPKDRYVNIHPAVLHLYCCLDNPDGVLPRMEGIINGVTTI